MPVPPPEDPAAGEELPPDPEQASPAPFPIVALGASAGGLQALEAFFSHMPAQSGMCFVVITHQHAEQPSLLTELLARRTAMPVVELDSATAAQPDHVYTVRPGHQLACVDGVLQPLPFDKGVALHMPVDGFFRSLADDRGEHAVAIVLSGTGSDGSAGLQAIKGGLGLAMAQDEKSAQYTGMPRSAVATELVDHVLPPQEMPRRLLDYIASRGAVRNAALPHDVPLSEAMRQIFALIRNHTRHDFSHYKRSTLRRRIERRMTVQRIEGLRAYVHFLRTHPGEIELLFKELLIGVTSFFRDPEAWLALATHLRQLLAELPVDYTFRAWISGCATGEEAYSLAILLREVMDGLQRSLSVQIFATDLNAAAIESARSGVYPEGIVHDLSVQRLSRFFNKREELYQVRREIREMLVFAPHNLIADPPFTKLDLLVCRNLLIYLDGSLQKTLIPTFHYALKNRRLLFLGSSESIGGAGDLFAISDKKWRIFERRGAGPGNQLQQLPTLANLPRFSGPSAAGTAGVGEGLALQAERMLLRELVPPTVLAHESGAVVHIHGRTGRFLEPAPGLQGHANIFNMVREGLRFGLSTALRQAARDEQEVMLRGISLQTNGEKINATIRVRRLTQPEALRGLFRITFEDAVAPQAADGQVESGEPAPDRCGELERELARTKERHQVTIEELETANEELKSTNEELQSTNEELQSTNEELETSKEEMQSLNEELQTVNAELQCKLELLTCANNDMKNLLDSTDIATIFLDNELRIKRYTEQARRVVCLIPGDVGRPLADLASSLHYETLVDDARQVLRTLLSKEAEIPADRDTRYLMRILPYRTTDNFVDGLVLTFVDITRFRALQGDQRRLLDALDGVPLTAFGHDEQLRYSWACGPVLGLQPAELRGRSDRELFGDTASELAALKQTVLQNNEPRHEIVHVTVNGKQERYELYAVPLRDEDGQAKGLFCLGSPGP